MSRFLTLSFSVLTASLGWLFLHTVAAPVPRNKDVLTSSTGLKLRRIPAGKFMMGSPAAEKGRGDDEGQHEVEISATFFIGVYEVTQGQYQRVMGKNPSYFSALNGGKERVKGQATSRFPVECVSYEDAVSFCVKLTRLDNQTGRKGTYRLPTEAEWEYACRGLTGQKASSVFHFGNALSSKEANFHGDYPYGAAKKGPYLGRTAPVGSYRPNGFGLCDMHGNVAEWCRDWYAKDYYKNSPRKDPPGPARGYHRVFRGGGCGGIAGLCRAAARGHDLPTAGSASLGFRVVFVPGR